MKAMKYAAHLYLEELVLAPSQEWTPFLPGWHFLWLAEGQCFWLGENLVVDLESGEILVLGPARNGVLRASQLGTARLDYFRLCPEYLAGLFSLNERKFLEKTALKPKLLPQKLNSDHPASRLFSSLNRSEPQDHGLEMRARLLQIAARSFDWSHSLPKNGPTAVLPANKRIKVLMSELTESELCKLSIADLAQRCGCTPQHFVRLFQNQFGVPLRTRQTELLLMNALQMLAETDAPIQEIAKAAGGRNVNAFNTLFKKEFGLTPAEFRRQRSRANRLSEEPDPPATPLAKIVL
jgi:AraC-like DNA-binding protein